MSGHSSQYQWPLPRHANIIVPATATGDAVAHSDSVRSSSKSSPGRANVAQVRSGGSGDEEDRQTVSSHHYHHHSHSQQPLPGMTRRNSDKKMTPPQEVGAGPFRFRAYQLMYPVGTPFLLYIAYQTSSESRPGYSLYESHLSPGWLLGRKIDVSDFQWHTFRQNLPTFAGALLTFVILNWVYKNIVLPRWWPLPAAAAASASVAHPVWASYRGFLPPLYMIVALSVVFLTVVTGSSILIILVLTILNYAIAKVVAGTRYGPFICWAFTISMLVCNERNTGYQFTDFTWLGGRGNALLVWLYDHRGILGRWDVVYNITMLRMVSFDMDYHWRILQERIVGRSVIDERVEELPSKQRSEAATKDRTEVSVFREDYCFGNYWAFLYYPPLYLTGPIMTFNNFISQARSPVCEACSTRNTIKYGLRLVLAMFLMELMLHMIHPVAISAAKVWADYNVIEIMTISYFYLTFIWLKLCIIWRFSRFWAMVDGVETIENMRRCMSNNYSLQLFWRDWHCSYNRWLVRYLYIPLGGSKTQPWNLFVVFTFVALWHDISSRLLMWAWLIAFLFLPEGLARFFFNQPHWRQWRWFRLMCAVGGGLNIFGMMMANLVGFAVGPEGMRDMAKQALTVKGSLSLTLIFVIFVLNTLTMFDWRGHEYYRDYMQAQTKQSPPLGATELEVLPPLSRNDNDNDGRRQQPRL